LSANESIIDHFGHTTFRLRQRGRQILVDPLLIRSSLRLREPGPPAWLIPDAAATDAVVISHGHDDHLHPASLVGLPADTRLFAYGDSACRKLAALGFRRVTTLRPHERIELTEDTWVTPLAAAASIEGTEQCALLFETPAATILDGVDVRDTAGLRAELAPHRGRVDVAFLPTAGSLQWQGLCNQMDAREAAHLAAWLGAGLVATCGGALSGTAPARPGALERYPSDRADWYAACQGVVEPERILWRAPPVRLRYRDHRLIAASSLAARRVGRVERCLTVQPAVAAYFTGYQPSSPTRRFPARAPDFVREFLLAWVPYRDALQAARGQLATLIRRCDPSAHQTAAAALLVATLSWLRRRQDWSLAGRLSAILPDLGPRASDPDEPVFAAAEAILRDSLGHDHPELSAGEACLAFDRAVRLLQLEAWQMAEQAGLDGERARVGRAEYLEDLRRTRAQRRPALGPNHLLIDAADEELLTGRPPAEGHARGRLFFATPSGVASIPLDETRWTVLGLCDGRTVAEIADALAGDLTAEHDEAERAVLEFLAGLTAQSIHLVQWGLG
jgi:L-ascorbate metabolism protein UlaG (beta-lactamase superfamily)